MLLTPTDEEISSSHPCPVIRDATSNLTIQRINYEVQASQRLPEVWPELIIGHGINDLI